jgi:3-oxoacyl-[acyl-carrier-protein] synthase II
MNIMKREIVLTAYDLISPIGVGTEEFWAALTAGKSGVGYSSQVDEGEPNRPLTAEAPDFRAKEYVKPRKNIKVMSRDIQLGFVAAMMAFAKSGLSTGADGAAQTIDPERIGVIFGCDLIGIDITELADAFRAGMTSGTYDFSTWGHAAMEKIMPLWMLKYLPNMPSSHIGIALDARGPNNSPTLDRAAALSSIIEAAVVLENGRADAMLCGGCGNRTNPSFLSRANAYGLAPWTCEPSSVPRPFDAERCGTVSGEGSGAFLLETREFAEARGAKPIAVLRGFSRVTDPSYEMAAQSGSVSFAIKTALKDAGMTAADLDHINADGMGTVQDDRAEATGIAEALGDLPVYAAKGHFGNLGSGTGGVELAASLLAMENGMLPAVLNCTKIADDCPINVVQAPRPIEKKAFIKINQTNMGRSDAVIFEMC